MKPLNQYHTNQSLNSRQALVATIVKNANRRAPKILQKKVESQGRNFNNVVQQKTWELLRSHKRPSATSVLKSLRLEYKV